MTFQVKTATLGMSEEAFAAHVSAFHKALVEYYKHLDGVRADAANPDLKPDERRVAFPPPTMDVLIENAIRREEQPDGSIKAVIDYAFVGLSLAEKKAALLAEKKAALFARVRKMEQEAIEANIPAAKRRHWQFLAADQISDGYSEVVGSYYDRLKKEVAIQRWAAKLEHDIADLTEATVDHFEIAPFNG